MTTAQFPSSQAAPRAGREPSTERSAADLSSLLVELSRLVKALAFYPADSAQRKALTERTFLAWQADLARSGPLTLIAETGRLRSPGLDTISEYGGVSNLASAMAAHQIERLEFTAALRREAFRDFAQFLAGTSSTEPRPPVEPQQWQLGRDGIAVDERNEITSTSPEPAPAIPAEVCDVDPAETTAVLPIDAAPTSHTPSDDAKPDPELAPLAASTDRRVVELTGALAVLEECDADDDYLALSKQIVRTACDLSRDGLEDEAYQVALILADHAIGDGGRSGVQARCAQTLLTTLANEAILPDLIARACSRPGSEGVRSAQVLLQLGGAAAPALFDALLREQSRERAAQLSGLIVALGDRARETLERHLQRAAGPQARLAARLVGELQNPASVQILAGLLASRDAGLRKEAAKALVTIGGRSAADSLTVLLSSANDELVELAALCLGELRDRRAVPGLLRELAGTASAGRFECAREIARALGQIGAEEAIPRLAATLGLRGFTQRRRRRELKLAAVAALGKFHARAAHVALTRASQNSDPRVRERAQQILSRGVVPARS